MTRRVNRSLTLTLNTQRIRSRFDGGGRVGGGAVSAPPNADGAT